MRVKITKFQYFIKKRNFQINLTNNKTIDFIKKIKDSN